MKARQVSDGDFEKVPAGMHAAVCIHLIDMGLQGGGKFEPAYKIAITWETPGELTKATNVPMSITQFYTFSMNKKANLRKLIENWRGKAFETEEQAADFDFKKLLGQPCLLNVTHDAKQDGKIYANVKSANPLVAGMAKPAAKAPLLYYSDDMPLAEKSAAYQAIPEWIRGKVDGQLQPKSNDAKVAGALASVGGGGQPGDPGAQEDDIAF